MKTWEEAVASKPETLSAMEYVRFRVLYKQFERGGVAGLGSIVKFARQIIKPFRNKKSK